VSSPHLPNRLATTALVAELTIRESEEGVALAHMFLELIEGITRDGLDTHRLATQELRDYVGSLSPAVLRRHVKTIYALEALTAVYRAADASFIIKQAKQTA